METQALQKENTAIDIAKLFFAYCIIAIHTVLFLDVHHGLWWFNNHMIWRLAVPFFFLTSGYFFNADKKDPNKFSGGGLLPVQVKRLIVPYFFWSAVCIIISAVNLRSIDIKGILFGYITADPGAAMWYVGAIIISMCILKFIRKKKHLQAVVGISAVVYFAGLLLGSYSGILRGTAAEPFLQKYYFDIFHDTNNVFFFGFPFFSFGYYIRQYGIPKPLRKKKNCIIAAVAFYVLLFAELLLVSKLLPEPIDGSYKFFVFLPFFEISLLCLLLQTEIRLNFDAKILRKLSTGIYFSHVAVYSSVYIISGVLYHFGIIPHPFNNTIVFASTAVLTTAIALVVYKIDNKYLNKLF